MLKIVGHESYIVLKEDKPDNNPNIPIKINKTPILIPKITNKTNRLTLPNWYNKYEDEIEKKWTEFVQLFNNMIFFDKYVCHYDMTGLKNDFIKLLYRTSDTTYKNFV